MQNKSLKHAGQQLRLLRRQSRLTQSELAKRAGVGCHTVSRWENKANFHRRSNALKRILAVLEPLHRYRAGLTRARGYGVLQARQKPVSIAKEKEWERKRTREKKNAARRRVLCGAKTRKGTLCRLMSEPGRRRCKFHGGKSTGPKNAGRAIAHCRGTTTPLGEV